ncbi:MAG: sulfite dehydrogenase [Myxococcota bacterium]
MTEWRAIAGGGLLDRRAFLTASLAVPGALSLGAAPTNEPWLSRPGTPPSGYGNPAPGEGGVARLIHTDYPGIAPGAGVSFTPLHQLRGRLTPNGLHFERHHAGIPAIGADQHQLVIHGAVDRPLAFRVEDLLRYPMESELAFLECSGNSLLLAGDAVPEVPSGVIHGLLSCSEWTGVRLGVLLEEAGIRPDAAWGIAEGGDAARMNRSIPRAKLLGDALVALYQNGERLRPEQGYPLRLFLPGWEGNTSIKWLRRLELRATPVHSREETSKYSDRMADGSVRQFSFEMGVKSIVTHPSPGAGLAGPGLYELSGLAWSGAGRVRRVEVSADGGASWADAVLEEPNLPRCLVRFRLPWRWNGAPSQIVSRATDETGAVQPTRDAWRAGYAAGQIYHYNAVGAWQVHADGRVTNAFV